MESHKENLIRHTYASMGQNGKPTERKRAKTMTTTATTTLIQIHRLYCINNYGYVYTCHTIPKKRREIKIVYDKQFPKENDRRRQQ